MVDNPQPTVSAGMSPIIRDSSFTRFSADFAQVSFLGYDIEAAFIAASPQPLAIEMVPGSDTQTIRTVATFAETARLRVNPTGATNIAMSLLRAVLASGSTDGMELRENLEATIVLGEQDRAAALAQLNKDD